MKKFLAVAFIAASVVAAVSAVAMAATHPNACCGEPPPCWWRGTCAVLSNK